MAQFDDRKIFVITISVAIIIGSFAVGQPVRTAIFGSEFESNGPGCRTQ
jgi:hypothetical protein